MAAALIELVPSLLPAAAAEAAAHSFPYSR